MESLTTYLPNFLFILLRAGIVLSLVPFFSSELFPPMFRIGMAVAISLVLTPVVEFHVATPEIPIVVFREILFGMAFGLAARFVFYAVDMAGQLMSNASGLSIATAFNPEIGQSSELSRIFGIIAMLIFLAMDIHHDVIYVFVKSYEWLPAGSALSAGSLVTLTVSFVTKMFIIALKISAPVVISMLIANVVLGFVYKAAPQINIFFLATPVYIFLGFLIMMISIPAFAYVAGGLFSSTKDEIGNVIMLLKG